MIDFEQLSIFDLESEQKFSDSKWMSASEKEKTFKTFKKLIEHRNIDLMDNRLYVHLHCHCDFIAHYNIHGFRDTYRGLGFKNFVIHIMKDNSLLYCEDFKDINSAMREYLRPRYKNILMELDLEEKMKTAKLVHSLIKRYDINSDVINSLGVQ